MYSAAVPFVVYPTNEQAFFHTDQDTADKAKFISSKGFRFECEVLPNNMVTYSISDGNECVYAIVCLKGPEVEHQLVNMIHNFYVRLKYGEE